MIDPKELRIGNWIIHPDNGFWQWQFSRDDWDWYEMEKFKPIELTPEILEQCGFEKGERFYKDTDAYWDETKRYFISNQWFHRKQAGEGSIILARDLFYVHQLQNLYFALTGEELTIKTISPAFSSPQP